MVRRWQTITYVGSHCRFLSDLLKKIIIFYCSFLFSIDIRSPTEGTVFSACDTSGCIQIFDTRAKNKSMLSKQVSKVDVNVSSLIWDKSLFYGGFLE